MLDWLFDWLQAFLQWLLDILLWVPIKLWELFLNVLATLLELVPVPDFISNAGVYLGGIPPGVAYFLGIVRFDYGLSVILAASILRFLIRRLPVVG